MGNGSALAGFLLLFGAMSASPTSAQAPPEGGAYERMTPGNQKVARALFDAQAVLPAAPTAAARSSRPLSLDQIAAQRQARRGWGSVFELMRSQGLVRETSLGHVVDRYEHQRRRAAVTTASRDQQAPK